MILSKEDADLFFKLLWHIHFYVNQQLQLVPNVALVEDYRLLPQADKLRVREQLWQNPQLIEQYAQDNPDSLSEEEVYIIRQWTRRVEDTFQIFRHLKKHTIFISSKSQVYAVLGLYDSIETILLYPLPVMVKAVLLPFKGQIVYDGLLQSYNILFGGGIRAGLKEDYMTAKQNNRIITTLEPEIAPPVLPPTSNPTEYWRGAVDEIVVLAEKLKGGTALQSAAFGLLCASARLSQTILATPDDVAGFWKLEQQVRRALTKLQTTLNRLD